MNIVPSSSIDDVRFVHDSLYSFNLSRTGEERKEIVIADDSSLRALMLVGDGGARKGGLVYRVLDNGQTFFVEYLWISDAVRGSGAGRKLIDAAQRVAVSHGCARIRLTTNSFQAPDFYRKLGFTLIGTTPRPTKLVTDNVSHLFELALPAVSPVVGDHARPVGR